MKNDFFIRNLIMHRPTGYVTIPLHSFVMSNLSHSDVVSAKPEFSPCGLDPVFVLKTKATISTQSRSDEIFVQLTDF